MFYQYLDPNIGTPILHYINIIALYYGIGLEFYFIFYKNVNHFIDRHSFRDCKIAKRL